MQEPCKVLVWGAGGDCKKNIELLPEEWEILAIVDSDDSKWGKQFNGTSKKIISPEECRDLDYSFIIIASSMYKKEIHAQMLAMHISPMKIIDGCRYHLNGTLGDHKKFYRSIIQRQKEQIDSDYRFEDRKRNCSKLFYVLSGYKEALWEDVFGRMKRFIPKDIDVCLLSSGLYSEKLSEIAEKNNWSYLSTSVNDVIIIQNIVISLFSKAELIYKMDEDIYITKDCCKKMETLRERLQGKNFKVGLIGPMIPLHTNGFLFLESFGLADAYKKEIGEELIWGGSWTNNRFGTAPEIPKFFWSQGNIDELNKRASETKTEYYITPIKYGICFILFSRQLYEEMGGFNVNRETRGFGATGDEGQISNFCMQHCLVNAVALNTVCGHFAFNKQHWEMLKFRDEHYEYFELRE